MEKNLIVSVYTTIQQCYAEGGAGPVQKYRDSNALLLRIDTSTTKPGDFYIVRTMLVFGNGSEVVAGLIVVRR